MNSYFIFTIATQNLNYLDLRKQGTDLYKQLFLHYFSSSFSMIPSRLTKLSILVDAIKIVNKQFIDVTEMYGLYFGGKTTQT